MLNNCGNCSLLTDIILCQKRMQEAALACTVECANGIMQNCNNNMPGQMFCAVSHGNCR